MNNVSFLRIRPCNSDNDLYLNSRKKELTSSFLVHDTDYDLNKIHDNGFQTISETTKINSFAWMVNHKNIEQFNSTDRKLLIYKMSNNKEGTKTTIIFDAKVAWGQLSNAASI